MKRYIKADANGSNNRKQTYTTYAQDTDITFILVDEWHDEDVVSTECVGFYYGEPNSRDTDEFFGKLKAEYYVPSTNTEDIEDRRKFASDLVVELESEYGTQISGDTWSRIEDLVEDLDNTPENLLEEFIYQLFESDTGITVQ